jgi:phage baseplate assembly protein W
MALATIEELRRALIGNGIIKPLRRLSGSDFVTGSGVQLIRAAISQILGTRVGELRWRPEFGIDLERYRHRPASDTTATNITEEILDALTTFEPRIRVSDVDVTIDENIIRIKILWLLASRGPEEGIILGPITTEVSV